MRLRFGLDDRDTEILHAHLSPDVLDSMEQGWEECIDAAMTHLLRTVLMKVQRTHRRCRSPFPSQQIRRKLQRHITIVCNRLAAGGRLDGSRALPSSSGQPGGTRKRTSTKTPAASETDGRGQGVAEDDEAAGK